MVPGLAVRGYARTACERLRTRDHQTELLPAPGEPGVPARLDEYGRMLAYELETGPSVDVLIGLSVGTQAAAIAAAATDRIGHLVLIAPTADPEVRTVPRLLLQWVSSGRVEDPGLFGAQLPDWRRAGIRALWNGVRSATDIALEDVLAEVSARVTIAHPECDLLTSHHFAAVLADTNRRFVVVPHATHSWPHSDADRFADLIERVAR